MKRYVCNVCCSPDSPPTKVGLIRGKRKFHAHTMKHVTEKRLTMKDTQVIIAKRLLVEAVANIRKSRMGVK